MVADGVSGCWARGLSYHDAHGSSSCAGTADGADTSGGGGHACRDPADGGGGVPTGAMAVMVA